MKKETAMVELSKLISNMGERGATKDEILNVVEFFKAAIETELACNSIYDFEILEKYRNKYSNEKES